MYLWCAHKSKCSRMLKSHVFMGMIRNSGAEGDLYQPIYADRIVHAISMCTSCARMHVGPLCTPWPSRINVRQLRKECIGNWHSTLWLYHVEPKIISSLSNLSNPREIKTQLLKQARFFTCACGAHAMFVGWWTWRQHPMGGTLWLREWPCTSVTQGTRRNCLKPPPKQRQSLSVGCISYISSAFFSLDPCFPGVLRCTCYQFVTLKSWHHMRMGPISAWSRPHSPMLDMVGPQWRWHWEF